MTPASPRIFATLLVVLAALGLTASAHAAPSSHGSPIWTADGRIESVAVSGSTAYVGGAFSQIGPYTGGSARVDLATGARSGAWPDVAGTVYTAEPDGNGGWYLGGAFDSVGGESRTNIAHVRADESLNPDWHPSVDGAVRAIAVDGATVYAGGYFKNVAGAPQVGLVALSAANGQRVEALKGVDGVNTVVVNALDIAGSPGSRVLYVGGRFKSADGVMRSNAAAYSTTTNEPVAFNPNVDGEVYGLDAAESGVYLVGGFRHVDGTARRDIARVEPTAGTVGAWDPKIDSNGSLAAVNVPGDGNVYVGGVFNRVNTGQGTEAVRRSVAAFSATTGAVTPWAPVVTSPAGVNSIEVVGTTVYLAGAIEAVQGQRRWGVAAVAASDGSLRPWDPKPDESNVLGVASDGTNVVIAGSFNGVGGVRRNGLAAIDLNTGEPTAFAPDVRASVAAVAVGPDGIWAAGVFNQIDGVAAMTDVAKFDPATGKRSSALAQRTDGQVRTLAVDGDDVYIGGTFTKVEATPRGNVAAIRDVPGTAGAILPWDPAANATVRSLARGADGRIYVGGEFATLKGGTVPRRFLASVGAAGAGEVTAFNPDPNNTVWSVAVSGTTVVAGGDFTTVNGTTARRGAAVFDSETGAPTSWDAGLTGPVRAVAADGESILAGGAFTGAAGAQRSYVAGFTPAGELLPWNPSLKQTTDQYPIAAIASTAGGWTVVAGRFILDRGPARGAQIAAFRNPSAATPAPPPGPGDPAGPAGPGGDGAGPDRPGGAGGPGGGVSADRRAPLLSRLGVSRKKFRVGRAPRRGTTFSLAIDEPGRVTFEVLGRRGRKTVKRGSFTKTLKTGRSKVKWDGKVSRRSLKPGVYTVRVIARDAAGNASRARTVKLRVVR